MERAEVVRVATPPASGTGAPRLFPSSLNWTVPVGVPVPSVSATVAVKVTGHPNMDGFAVEVTAVVVVEAAGEYRRTR